MDRFHLKSDQRWDLIGHQIKSGVSAIKWKFAYQFGSGAISIPLQDEVGLMDQFAFAAVVEERRYLLHDGLIHFGEILRLGRLLHQINQQATASVSLKVKISGSSCNFMQYQMSICRGLLIAAVRVALGTLHAIKFNGIEMKYILKWTGHCYLWDPWACRVRKMRLQPASWCRWSRCFRRYPFPNDAVNQSINNHKSTNLHMKSWNLRLVPWWILIVN